MTQTTKTCGECGENKPLSAYYLDKGKPRARCKDCHKAAIYARRQADPDGFRDYMAGWRERNRTVLAVREAKRRDAKRDEINAGRRAARVAHPERFRETARLYRAANREAVQRRNQRWARANRAKLRASNRASRKRHLARVQAREASYRAANREQIRERNKRYASANPEVIERHRQRRRALLASVEFDETVTRTRVYQRDGGLCRACAERVAFQDYELDHIVPVSLGGPHVWSNVQVLCRPCNREKRARLEGQIALPV